VRSISDIINQRKVILTLANWILNILFFRIIENLISDNHSWNSSSDPSMLYPSAWITNNHHLLLFLSAFILFLIVYPNTAILKLSFSSYPLIDTSCQGLLLWPESCTGRVLQYLQSNFFLSQTPADLVNKNSSKRTTNFRENRSCFKPISVFCPLQS